MGALLPLYRPRGVIVPLVPHVPTPMGRLRPGLCASRHPLGETMNDGDRFVCGFSLGL